MAGYLLMDEAQQQIYIFCCLFVCLFFLAMFFIPFHYLFFTNWDSPFQSRLERMELSDRWSGAGVRSSVLSGWALVDSRFADVSPRWFLMGLLASYVAEWLLCLRPGRCKATEMNDKEMKRPRPKEERKPSIGLQKVGHTLCTHISIDNTVRVPSSTI